MSDDFEARRANISTGANAAEQLYYVFLDPPSRTSIIHQLKQARGW